MDDPRLIASDITPADFAMSRDVAERLHAKYPGHLWAVQAQQAQGVMYVRNLMMSDRHAYVIHLADHASASDLMRKVDEAGGEMLERFRMARGRIDWDAVDAAEKTARGHLIGDLS